VKTKLTDKQMKVVRWLARNNKEEPYAAVAAGIISGTALTTWGGADTVKGWLAEFIASQPPPPMTQEQITARIQSMVPDAINTIQTTLRNGRGDKVAADLAKWVLKEAVAPAPEVVAPTDETELDNLIKATFGR
jgi:hypothetical protein